MEITGINYDQLNTSQKIGIDFINKEIKDKKEMTKEMNKYISMLAIFAELPEFTITIERTIK